MLSMMGALRCKLAERLERGSPPRGPLAMWSHRWLEQRWSAGLRRPLVLPNGVLAIGVGGATLGGSGKTPLSIALCAALANRGWGVALVGHAYGASPGQARVVTPTDNLRAVGDEALLAAEALAGVAHVVVGCSRQAAAQLAAQHARVLVFDGLLQAHPRRLARSLLTIDPSAPWGGGWVPPFGDLRGSPRALIEASDAIALVGDECEAAERGDCQAAERRDCQAAERGGLLRLADLGIDVLRPVVHVPWRIRRATAPGGHVWELDYARQMRCGLLLGLARPDRIAQALARRGIQPVTTITWADHQPATPDVLERASQAGRTHRVDVWLTTAKCRTRLPRSVASVPVLALAQELSLTDDALETLLGEATTLCDVNSSVPIRPQ